jgi:hypothetical protein
MLLDPGMRSQRRHMNFEGTRKGSLMKAKSVSFGWAEFPDTTGAFLSLRHPSRLCQVTTVLF